MLIKGFWRLVFYFIILIFHTAINAQEFSVQLSPGIINYGGDLQTKVYTFSHANFSIGAGLVYRINKISFRGGLTLGKIDGDDLSNTGYKSRNLSFASNITEANLCVQYDFFSMDNHRFTPYIFAGIGLYHFNPYTYYDSQKVYLQPLGTEGQGLSIYPDKKLYSLTQASLPYGIGFKYKVSDRIAIGIEFCIRYLFTDYLDDVSNTYPDENELFKQRGQLAVDLSFRGNEIDPSLTFPSGSLRGNPKLNDTYYTSAFTFIYTFPQRTLYNTGGGKQKKLRIDCPKHIH